MPTPYYESQDMSRQHDFDDDGPLVRTGRMYVDPNQVYSAAYDQPPKTKSRSNPQLTPLKPTDSKFAQRHHHHHHHQQPDGPTTDDLRHVAHSLLWPEPPHPTFPVPEIPVTREDYFPESYSSVLSGSPPPASPPRYYLTPTSPLSPPPPRTPPQYFTPAPSMMQPDLIRGYSTSPLISSKHTSNSSPYLVAPGLPQTASSSSGRHRQQAYDYDQYPPAPHHTSTHGKYEQDRRSSPPPPSRSSSTRHRYDDPEPQFSAPSMIRSNVVGPNYDYDSQSSAARSRPPDSPVQTRLDANVVQAQGSPPPPTPISTTFVREAEARDRVDRVDSRRPPSRGMSADDVAPQRNSLSKMERAITELRSVKLIFARWASKIEDDLKLHNVRSVTYWNSDNKVFGEKLIAVISALDQEADKALKVAESMMEGYRLFSAEMVAQLVSISRSNNGGNLYPNEKLEKIRKVEIYERSEVLEKTIQDMQNNVHSLGRMLKLENMASTHLRTKITRYIQHVFDSLSVTFSPDLSPGIGRGLCETSMIGAIVASSSSATETLKIYKDMKQLDSTEEVGFKKLSEYLDVEITKSIKDAEKAFVNLRAYHKAQQADYESKFKRSGQGWLSADEAERALIQWDDTPTIR